MSAPSARQYVFQVEYIFDAVDVESDWFSDTFKFHLDRFVDKLRADPRLEDENFLARPGIKPPLLHLAEEQLPEIDATDPAIFTVDDAGVYGHIASVTSERHVFWGTAILENRPDISDRDQVRNLLRQIFYPTPDLPRFEERIRGPFRWVAWHQHQDPVIGPYLTFLGNGGSGGDR
jgi:hypothetical protein